MNSLIVVWALIFVVGESPGRAVYFETQAQCEEALKAAIKVRNGWSAGICAKVIR